MIKERIEEYYERTLDVFEKLIDRWLGKISPSALPEKFFIEEKRIVKRLSELAEISGRYGQLIIDIDNITFDMFDSVENDGELVKIIKQNEDCKDYIIFKPKEMYVYLAFDPRKNYILIKTEKSKKIFDDENKTEYEFFIKQNNNFYRQEQASKLVNFNNVMNIFGEKPILIYPKGSLYNIDRKSKESLLGGLILNRVMKK